MKNKKGSILMFLVLLLASFAIIAMVTHNEVDEHISALEYCKSNGYDGFAYDCDTFFCFNKEYYCKSDKLNASLVFEWGNV